MKIEETTARDYIREQLASQSILMQTIAMEYTKHASELGGRICNDGYPDARFKVTYGKRWEGIRQYIGQQRQRYASAMHKMHAVRVCCCKCDVVSPEVAQSHIDKIRTKFNWS